jgi:hypothetical protein
MAVTTQPLPADARGAPSPFTSGIHVGHKATPGHPVSYTREDGKVIKLVPWNGRYVVLLTPRHMILDRTVMGTLLHALDAGYTYYYEITGHAPPRYAVVHHRLPIAVVTATCGAGCSWVGMTGMEWLKSFFVTAYDEVRDDAQYDQVPFYEFGRNFWYDGAQLAYQSPQQDPVVTGFAVLMRFRSMNAAGLPGAPFNGTPFPQFESQVRGIIGDYEADLSKTWANTLAQDQSPSVDGGTDFWASIMMRLARHYGGNVFLSRFFRQAPHLPAAPDTVGAVTNWVDAASFAACADLRAVFYQRWSFPQPNGATDSRQPASNVAMPAGGCRDSKPPVTKVVPVHLGAAHMIRLRWHATDSGNRNSGSGAAVYALRVRISAKAGSRPHWMQLGGAPVVATTHLRRVRIRGHRRYCFEARAWDVAGNRGQWSHQRCAVG